MKDVCRLSLYKRRTQIPLQSVLKCTITSQPYFSLVFRNILISMYKVLPTYSYFRDGVKLLIDSPKLFASLYARRLYIQWRPLRVRFWPIRLTKGCVQRKKRRELENMNEMESARRSLPTFESCNTLTSMCRPIPCLPEGLTQRVMSEKF